MKNIIKRYTKPVALCSILLIMVVASCKKDDYYDDGGKANPVFNGSILEYLQSNDKFDTIAQIVKLADMEDVFKNETITFFCPTDEVVRRTIGQVNSNITELKGGLNQLLFDQGKDTITTLSDVAPEIWRKYLTRYMFKGAYKLKDYPQLDFQLKELYPGSFYYTYNNDIANIGVVYNSVNSVKYTGYRQLSISYLQDPSDPSNFLAAAVASSDIQPSNGVVHVLAITIAPFIGETFTMPEANYFGFGFDFFSDVLLSK